MDPKRIEQLASIMRRNNDVGERGISDAQAVRHYTEEEDENGYKDIRPPFFRDVDRIVHSLSYARYIDKSQVFFNINNANITHRSLHVILVSRISRQIGRVLRLNSDLIEAIALGHDIGHSPFGHLGEEILDEICKKYNMGKFMHNAQGVRWLSYLEKRFPEKPAKGLNLNLQVLDGILCHDGEANEKELKPIKVNGKSWNDHFREYDDCFNENKIRKIPMSYEGIAVRFADTIAYIGRDIEDSILLKFIERKEIPETCKKILGDTNRKIMNTLIMDLLNYSLDHDTIGYSNIIFEALKELKQFNYDKIYYRRDASLLKKGLIKKFELIFERCLTDLEKENYNSPIFKDHIDYIDDVNRYNTYFKPLQEKNNLTLIVRDYIAGMSDKYFNEIAKRFKNSK